MKAFGGSARDLKAVAFKGAAEGITADTWDREQAGIVIKRERLVEQAPAQQGRVD